MKYFEWAINKYFVETELQSLEYEAVTSMTKEQCLIGCELVQPDKNLPVLQRRTVTIFGVRKGAEEVRKQMHAVDYFQMLVNFYQTERHHTP